MGEDNSFGFREGEKRFQSSERALASSGVAGRERDRLWRRDLDALLRECARRAQNCFKDLGLLPLPKAPANVVRLPVLLRHVDPTRAGAQGSQDAVQNASTVISEGSNPAPLSRQKRGKAAAPLR